MTKSGVNVRNDIRIALFNVFPSNENDVTHAMFTPNTVIKLNRI